MSMTSRERVLAAINHQEPDRVPIDLGGTRVTSITVGVYARLLDSLGIDSEPPKVMDVWQMLAWVEQPVVDALGIDVLPVPRLVQDFGMRRDHWVPWQLMEDGTPVQMPGGFDPVTEVTLPARAGKASSAAFTWLAVALCLRATVASVPYFSTK